MKNIINGRAFWLQLILEKLSYLFTLHYSLPPRFKKNEFTSFKICKRDRHDVSTNFCFLNICLLFHFLRQIQNRRTPPPPLSQRDKIWAKSIMHTSLIRYYTYLLFQLVAYDLCSWGYGFSELYFIVGRFFMVSSS